MSQVNFGPALCNEAEIEKLKAAAEPFWAVIAGIIDASPHYVGSPPHERLGHIVHMANQAILYEASKGGPDASRAMMFGAARIIGNVLSQAPSPEHMEVGKRYIAHEINQGMADHIRVAEARGSA
jgi:hypothetical protein